MSDNEKRYLWLREHWDAITGITWRGPCGPKLDAYIDAAIGIGPYGITDTPTNAELAAILRDDTRIMTAPVLEEAAHRLEDRAEYEALVKVAQAAAAALHEADRRIAEAMPPEKFTLPWAQMTALREAVADHIRARAGRASGVSIPQEK